MSKKIVKSVRCRYFLLNLLMNPVYGVILRTKSPNFIGVTIMMKCEKLF